MSTKDSSCLLFGKTSQVRGSDFEQEEALIHPIKRQEASDKFFFGGGLQIQSASRNVACSSLNEWRNKLL